MSHEQLYEGVDPHYRANAFGVVERIGSSKRRRPTYGRRRGKTPQSFNGIHRRRRRKVAW
jgi:hypothetical protein